MHWATCSHDRRRCAIKNARTFWVFCVCASVRQEMDFRPMLAQKVSGRWLSTKGVVGASSSTSVTSNGSNRITDEYLLGSNCVFAESLRYGTVLPSKRHIRACSGRMVHIRSTDDVESKMPACARSSNRAPCAISALPLDLHASRCVAAELAQFRTAVAM